MGLWRHTGKGMGVVCKGGQQACLFIFFSDLISLRLFSGLVQVIGPCGTCGVLSLPADIVPGGPSEAYP